MVLGAPQIGKAAGWTWVWKPPAAPDINALVTGLQGGLVGERLAAQLSPKPIVQCSVSLTFNK